MKKTTLWIIALFAVATLAGCNKAPVENPNENVEIANPASVYCEENGGTLKLEEGAWLCMFKDWSYCEEWAYKNGECKPWDIFYNTLDEQDELQAWYELELWASELYSEKDLKSAANAIMNIFNNEWEIKCDMKKLSYLWDEISTENLNYCKNFYSDVEDCVVFTSDFYIPNTDQEMAWAFEPDKNIEWWSWYLWRIAGEDWIVLTNGL